FACIVDRRVRAWDRIRRRVRHHAPDRAPTSPGHHRLLSRGRSAGDEPIACLVIDVRGRDGSGDPDFYPATIARAAGRVHDRTALARARTRRHGDARSPPLRRDHAARAGALRMAARLGGAGDRHLRHRARALPAAGSGRLRSRQPHLPVSGTGQDATAICGTLAGAAVAAKLLGLDAKAIANAVGIAVSFAAGSLEGSRSGGTIKRFQSGWAAKSAIQAALLAKYGVDGPAQAIEGRYGFYHCFVDGQFDPHTLTDGLGSV